LKLTLFVENGQKIAVPRELAQSAAKWALRSVATQQVAWVSVTFSRVQSFVSPRGIANEAMARKSSE
jgi:hypothetical protein